MKATQWRVVSNIVLIASLVFLASTLILPYVKFPESVNYSVAASHPAGETPRFYDVPPVDSGTPVYVTFTGFQPEGLQFALSPVQGNTLLRSLALGTVGGGNNYNFSVVPRVTAELRLLVISFNGSGYTVQISSSWSPYYDLRVYTSPAVFLVVASGLASYYYRQMIPKQRAEEKVEEELRAEARGRQVKEG